MENFQNKKKLHLKTLFIHFIVYYKYIRIELHIQKQLVLINLKANETV